MNGLERQRASSLVRVTFNATLADDSRELHIQYQVENTSMETLLVLDRLQRPSPDEVPTWTDACFHLIEGDTLVLGRHAYTGIWVAMYVPIWPSARVLAPKARISQSMTIPVPIDFWNPWVPTTRTPWSMITCTSIVLRLGVLRASDAAGAPEVKAAGDDRIVRVPFQTAADLEDIIDSEPLAMSVPVRSPRFIPSDIRIRGPAK